MSRKKTNHMKADDRIAVIVSAINHILRRKASSEEAQALSRYVASRMSRKRRAKLDNGFDKPATEAAIITVLRLTEAGATPP